MSIFRLPEWLDPHLFPGKNFNELTSDEISNLSGRLQKFNPANPEVSVVIPAWNEENNIFRTLSSLASTSSDFPVEIIVINNNSSDNTQKVLDTLGVKNYLQPRQGTPFARQMGLEKARGRFFLCADSDTFYPSAWVNAMVTPLKTDPTVACVYGTYSFMPPEGQSRFSLSIYETVREVIIRKRRQNEEFMNVYGFNMGFETQKGLLADGFRVHGERIYTHVKGSDFTNEAEDGRMALNLSGLGKLHRVMAPEATVFTSSRRLMDDGSIAKAFANRVKRQFKRLI